MKRKEVVYGIVIVLLMFCFCTSDLYAESRISIDASHKYRGMNASFAKGYEPSIEKDTMLLVVPFISEQHMKKNQIRVGIDFQKEENGPFYYKNYQKQVRQQERGVYLYQCRLKLKKDRVNGQYPLHLWAEGYLKQQDAVIRQEFTIYVEITDGKPQVGTTDEDHVIQELPVEDNFTGEPSPPLAEESIQSAGEEKISQPRLLTDKNNLLGKPLEAGGSQFWNFTIKNCSSQYAVENVKIRLLTDHRDILFEKTAWYFDKVSAKSEMDLSQNVSITKKAAAESVPLEFQIEYEDSKGNSYSSGETVNLWISQPQHAELSGLVFPEHIYASDTAIMTFQVQNTGLATVYNAKVRLEGKGLFPREELFLGNLEGGASQPGELQVFAGTLDMDNQGNIIEEGGEKYGDTSGVVTFSYEDEQGQVIEQSMEVHTSIKEPEIVELKVEKEVPETNQWWITIVAGIILALVLVVIWLYLRMKYYQTMRQ